MKMTKFSAPSDDKFATITTLGFYYRNNGDNRHNGYIPIIDDFIIQFTAFQFKYFTSNYSET